MFGAEGIFPQVLEIRLRRAVFLDLCLAGRVELDVLRIDDHVHAFEPSQLPELRGRERGLRCAASPQHHDLADPALAQPLQRMVGDVGLAQGIRGDDQHACDIHCDIAIADDDGPLAGQVDRQIAVIRMAVVPADERDGWKAVVQILSGDAHTPIGLGTDGIDDLIVEPLQFLVMDLDTVGDVAEETDSRIRQRPVQNAGHRLDRLVIGRNTVTDQPERCGETIEDIDCQDEVGFLEKSFGGIEPRWSSANDGDA